jgi:hypothetical protein
MMTTFYIDFDVAVTQLRLAVPCSALRLERIYDLVEQAGPARDLLGGLDVRRQRLAPIGVAADERAKLISRVITAARLACC